MEEKPKWSNLKLSDDLKALFERTDASSRRTEELFKRTDQERAETKRQIDAIYEETGRKLAAIDQEEIKDAERLRADFEEEGLMDAEEERREKAGLPPPLRPTK